MHIHHIVPKHAGGSDDPSNLVSVSIEEHAELHLALYLEHGKVADWVAYHCLSGKTDEAELMRVELSREAMKSWVPTEEQRAKMRENGKKTKGRKHSEETKRKIRESNVGQVRSAEARAKMSKAKKGKPSSEKAKMSRAKTYLVKYSNGETETITHLSRWCRENGYNQPAMYCLMRGEQKYHKDILSIEKV